MKNKSLIWILAVTLTAALAFLPIVLADAPPGPFFQGFEVDNSGWNVFGGALDATRVASGTHGVMSKTGGFHAEAATSATRWGGYSALFPAGGYTTQVDIYLNVAGGAANDTRFDFSSAINDSSGNFRRDFVFNAGFYNDTDVTGSGNRFVITASNNAGRAGSFPKNPGRSPVTITKTGWYSFRHRFYDRGGVLAVELSITDANGGCVKEWTLSDPTDTIITTGGNRYGWFASNEFAVLAFDNSERSGTPPGPVTACNELKVSPVNMQGWQIQTSSTATAAFVTGPKTPPIGIGSGELRVGADGDSGAQFRNPNFGGTMLNTLTELRYNTYVSNDSTAPAIGDQTPYIILNVDRDSNGTLDDLLFFEPEYQHGYTANVPDQGDNVLNTWQSWDALHGGWYGIDANTGDPTFAGAGADVQLLSAYVSANPSAKIMNNNAGGGGVRLVAGFGAGAWDNFVGNVDAVSIRIGTSCTSYNFDPRPRPIVADFDGDEKTDLSVFRPSDGTWQIRNSSDGSTTTRQWGAPTDKLVPGDYDGDRKTDIAVWRPSEGNWYIVNSATATVTVRNWGASTDVPVPGDYDGDGKTDIAVWRPSDGNWYIINSSNNTLTVRAWGAPTDIPAQGDYDGDLKDDIAVWRPAEGKWYIVNSSTNAMTTNVWGASTDKLVPGDYDRDGRTDSAVWRPSDGNWYVLKSTGGAVVRNWGAGSDKLVPGDYDGDGQTDIAVFRPSEDKWYIINSDCGGIITSTSFGLSDASVIPIPSAYLPQ
jgi:FG-GAP-like repeat/FG-GAP repeat